MNGLLISRFGIFANATLVVLLALGFLSAAFFPVVVNANSQSADDIRHNHTIEPLPRMRSLEGVPVTGPITGSSYITYTFLATVTPPTLPSPVTYTWSASGHESVTHASGVSDTYSLWWDSWGVQTMTVAAHFNGVTLTDTHVITLIGLPPDIGPPPQITLSPLQKEFGPISSRYVITNTFDCCAALTRHDFYDTTNQFVGSFSATIEPGGSTTFDLAEISALPYGFQGYVVIEGGSITGTVLTALQPSPTLNCTQPLTDTGFEGDDWVTYWNREPNVTRTALPHQSGFFSMSAPSFDINFRNPYFYQQIKMPALLTTVSTIQLSAYTYVDQLSNGADPHDEFQVALVTQAPPPFSQITSTLQTTFVATAATPLATGADTNKVWNFRAVSLHVTPGIKLEDYAGQPLYLLFYNNTNAKARADTGNCPPYSAECGATDFYFDDIDLQICSPVTTIYLPVILRNAVHP